MKLGGEVEEKEVAPEPLPEKIVDNASASSEELVAEEPEKWEEEIVPLNEQTPNRTSAASSWLDG